MFGTLIVGTRSSSAATLLPRPRVGVDALVLLACCSFVDWFVFVVEALGLLAVSVATGCSSCLRQGTSCSFSPPLHPCRYKGVTTLGLLRSFRTEVTYLWIKFVVHCAILGVWWHGATDGCFALVAKPAGASAVLGLLLCMMYCGLVTVKVGGCFGMVGCR